MTPGLIADDGEIREPSTTEFLQHFMSEFHIFTGRVLVVLPPDA